jgi:RNA methyltransferase, TrmH family
MKITESMVITSKDNARLKLARAVRDGRERESIYLEGARLVSEVIRSGLNARSLFVSDEAAARLNTLVDEVVSKTGAEVLYVDSKIFDSIADTNNSQGIVLLADKPGERTLGELMARPGLIIHLNRINTPANLGAVIRTAEAAGASGIVISPGSADPFSPKGLRSSMGSALRMAISTEISIEAAVAFARKNGIRTFAADIKAKRSYTETDWRSPAILFFGSEAHGLSDDELGQVDETIYIPMENDVESLNLAVSAGILLFEAKRQRDAS